MRLVEIESRCEQVEKQMVTDFNFRKLVELAVGSRVVTGLRIGFWKLHWQLHDSL